MNRATVKGDALLLFAAAIWGGAFVAQRTAMQHSGPLTFNGLRFALGALVLLPILCFRRWPGGASIEHSRRVSWLWGVLAGLVLFAGAALQQVGMIDTTAAKAGFITSLYIVLVPVFGLAIRQRTAGATWLGIALAAVGLYFLSLTTDFRIERGDGLILGCAAVFAVHVLLIGWLAPRTDWLKLAIMQYLIVAALSLGVAAWTEPIGAGLGGAVVALAYAGVLSVGVAYTFQVIGQRTAPAAHAGLLMSTESVFAALSGVILLGERLTAREWLGCALMLAGMLVSQVRREIRMAGLTRAPSPAESSRNRTGPARSTAHCGPDGPSSAAR